MYDAAVTSKEKAFKLLRTLPESFAPLAMVVQTNDRSLEKIIVSIEGQLSRRNNRDKVLKGFQLMKPLAPQGAKREKMDAHFGQRKPLKIGHVLFAAVLGIFQINVSTA